MHSNDSSIQLSKIVNAVKALPSGLALTPVKEKRPLRKGWQTEPPLSTEVLLGELETEKWDGIGLRTGDVSGGLLAIDVDGPSAQRIKDAIETTVGELPQTVAWASGKPGRYQLLYQIPERYRKQFTSLTKIARHSIDIGGKRIEGEKDPKTNKWEQIEFRYNAMQSVLPPSSHPETDGYGYLDGQSFDDVAIAILPDKIADFILSLHNPPKPQSKPDQKIKRNSYGIEDGGTMSDDERDRRLALEILDQLPPSDPGSGTYDEYRGVSVALSKLFGESDAIAMMESHSPGRNWRQIIQSSDGPFDMTTVVKVARAYISGWDYPQWWIDSMPKDYKKNNVVPINKNQPKPTAKDWQAEVKALAYSDLSTGELELQKMAIATDNKIPLQSVEKVYQVFVIDREREENKDSIKAELDQLITANTNRLDLERILPKRIAYPINKLANDIGLRPETYATALFAAASSCLDPRTKLTLIKRTGFDVKPPAYFCLIGDSSQGKSPITNEIIGKPFKVLQRELHEQYKEKRKQYENDYQAYQTAIKDGEEAEEPEEPKEVLMDIANFTVEALKDKLAYQQDKKGLLANFDELAGLITGLGQYKGGKGSDRQDLLSFYDGNGFSVARKSGDTRAENCSLSIFGGMQPSVLGEFLNGNKKGISDGDGQWARFAFVYQPPTPILLPETDDEPCTVATELTELYRNLMQIGEQHLTLSPQAYRLFKEATDPIERERVSMSDHPIANALGKQRGRIGKFCILLHCIDWAMGETQWDTVIGDGIMRRALAINKFYDSQLRAIYAQLDRSRTSLAPELSKLLELKPKGTITVRDATRKVKTIKSGDAVMLFDQLADLGYGTVVKVKPVTGRPTVAFEFRQGFGTFDTFDTVLTPTSVKTQTHTEQGLQDINNSFDTFDTNFSHSIPNNKDHNLPNDGKKDDQSFDTDTYAKSVKSVKSPQTYTESGVYECQNYVKTSVKTQGSVKTSDKTQNRDQLLAEIDTLRRQLDLTDNQARLKADKILGLGRRPYWNDLDDDQLQVVLDRLQEVA